MEEGQVYTNGGYDPNYYGSAYASSQPMVVESSRRRSHRHHHGSHHSHSHGTPTVITTGGGGQVVVDGRHHRSHSRHGGRFTFGQRIAHIFGFGRRGYKKEKRTQSWGFLGRSRRRRYRDAATGAEVDRKGRPVYRV
ncbi:hypothetical protein DL96DRAFT_975652 [Flagelloscypha sp. PMI_526]|nr:hypothetical protein DL96DRAFT_975652 [Flagelloscypha sp. PMI_526]